MKKITIFFMITFFILISGKNLSLELSLNHFFSSDFNYYYDDVDKEASILAPYTYDQTRYYYLYENARLKLNYKIPLNIFQINISPIVGIYDKRIYKNDDPHGYELEKLTLLKYEKNLLLFLLKLSVVSKIRIRKDDYLKIGFIYNIRYFPDTKKFYYDNNTWWTLGYLGNIYLELYLKNWFKFYSFERTWILEFLSEKKFNFGFIIYGGVKNLSLLYISLRYSDLYQDDYSSPLSMFFTYKYKFLKIILNLSIYRFIVLADEKYYHKIFPINLKLEVEL